MEDGNHNGQYTLHVSDNRSIAHYYASPYVIEIGFHMLSTPALFRRGWGRQIVETSLVKIDRKCPVPLA